MPGLPQQVPDRPLTPDQIREILERVLLSPLFSRSPALRAFLRYITETTIAGDLDKIKEHFIGSAALGRRLDYDPSTDNIVRVRAHQLRQKLDEHFATFGIDEPVVISVPRGAYIPEFRFRRVTSQLTADSQAVDSPACEADGAEPAEFEISRAAALASSGSSRIWPYVPWILSAVLAAALTWSVLHNSRSRPAAGTVRPQGAMLDFWGPLFDDSKRDVLVVSADSGFALWQNLSKQDLNLGDYLARKYLQLGPSDPYMRELAARRLTSPADVAITARLSDLGQAFGVHLAPQYARNIGVQQFLSANAVLIGSRLSNPWVELFEGKLNFVLGRDDKTGASVFLNRLPKQGEAAGYSVPEEPASRGTEEHEVDSYALVAVVAGLAANGRVVLIEGLNMEGAEAAGEVITDPARLVALLRQMGHQAGTPVPPFEALLKLTSVPGGYADCATVAFRYPKK